jgi:hypothetical protein
MRLSNKRRAVLERMATMPPRKIRTLPKAQQKRYRRQVTLLPPSGELPPDDKRPGLAFSDPESAAIHVPAPWLGLRGCERYYFRHAFRGSATQVRADSTVRCVSIGLATARQRNEYRSVCEWPAVHQRRGLQRHDDHRGGVHPRTRDEHDGCGRCRRGLRLTAPAAVPCGTT